MHRKSIAVLATAVLLTAGLATGGSVAALGDNNPPTTTETQTTTTATSTTDESDGEAKLPPDPQLLNQLRGKVVYYRGQTCYWRHYAFARCARAAHLERQTQDVTRLQHLAQYWRTQRAKAKRYALSFKYAMRYLPPAQARIVGQRMAAKFYHWTGAQWRCLDTIWGTRSGRALESGWYARADNPISPAHGIPQANPGSKMGPGWWDNVYVQIKWGLGYVLGSYRTPCGALSFRLANGSY